MRKPIVIGLLLVACLLCADIVHLTGIVARNRIFLLYVQLLTDELHDGDERVNLLRSIHQVSAFSHESHSSRESMLAASVNRILTQVELDSGEICEVPQSVSSANQLPQPVPVGDGLELLQMELLSGSGDYAADNDLSVRMLFRSSKYVPGVPNLRVDVPGWRLSLQGEQIVACGKSPNLLKNAGYELPAFTPPILPGVLDPIRWWGSGPEGWTSLSKEKGIDGESICVSKTRLAPPMARVSRGQLLAFGGYYRGSPYPIMPYLVVINGENPAEIPVTLEPSVVKDIDDSDWRFAYGVAQAPVDGYVTLYVDGWQNPDSVTCLDNVFIIPIPNVLQN